jgi:hypothetical protein
VERKVLPAVLVLHWRVFFCAAASSALRLLFAIFACSIPDIKVEIIPKKSSDFVDGGSANKAVTFLIPSITV